MSPVYAAPDDWDPDLYGPIPANATRLLAQASRQVTDATSCDTYDTDANGLPTDTGLLAAMRDATLTQAAAWATLGIDPTIGGLAAKAPVSSKSLDGGSVSYDNSLNASVTAFRARQQLAAGLCDDAARILRQAGLGYTQPWEFG